MIHTLYHINYIWFASVFLCTLIYSVHIKILSILNFYGRTIVINTLYSNESMVFFGFIRSLHSLISLFCFTFVYRNSFDFLNSISVLFEYESLHCGVYNLHCIIMIFYQVFIWKNNRFFTSDISNLILFYILHIP